MQTPPVAPGRRRRLRTPRDWSLRVKLGVILLVPGLLAVVLGVLRMIDQTGQAADADHMGQVASAEGGVATLIERLQTERVAAAEYVAGARRGDPAPLVGTTVASDRSAGPAGADVALLDGDATIGDTVAQARQALTVLPALRSDVRGTPPGPAIDQRYGDVIGRIDHLDQALLRDLGDARPDSRVSGLISLSDVRDEMALQLALVTGASAGPPTAMFVPMVESNARLTSALARFHTSLDADDATRLGGLVGGSTDVDRQAVGQRLLAGAAVDAVSPATLFSVGPADQAFLADIDRTMTGLRADLSQSISARRTGAIDQVVVNGVLLLLALLIGAAIVARLSHQMLTSLRTLRASTLEIARRRIPEAATRMREGGVPDVDIQPVPVRSREEIGEVARAIDAMHQQAVRLAAEQATLQSTVNGVFVNLSRRSQSLVDRQLQLIEELERGEQDPEQLAHLFRLDHLATRMRRNSENLLVLAGTDVSERAAHRVPVVDVLRAAVSETEQYERLTLDQQPTVAVTGRAANDLQHLVAELLDNAASFSSPGSPIVLGTTVTATGALIIEIVDHGVGMAAPDLAAANGLLGQRHDLAVAASRRMGLFVVSRLAARHGIVVRLVTGAPPDGGGTPGLTARVTVPKSVVVAGSSVTTGSSVTAGTGGVTAGTGGVTAGTGGVTGNGGVTANGGVTGNSGGSGSGRAGVTTGAVGPAGSVADHPRDGPAAGGAPGPTEGIVVARTAGTRPDPTRPATPGGGPRPDLTRHPGRSDAAAIGTPDAPTCPAPGTSGDVPGPPRSAAVTAAAADPDAPAGGVADPGTTPATSAPAHPAPTPAAPARPAPDPRTAAPAGGMPAGGVRSDPARPTGARPAGARPAPGRTGARPSGPAQPTGARPAAAANPAAEATGTRSGDAPATRTGRADTGDVRTPNAETTPAPATPAATTQAPATQAATTQAATTQAATTQAATTQTSSTPTPSTHTSTTPAATTQTPDAHTSGSHISGSHVSDARTHEQRAGDSSPAGGPPGEAASPPARPPRPAVRPAAHGTGEARPVAPGAATTRESGPAPAAPAPGGTGARPDRGAVPAQRSPDEADVDGWRPLRTGELPAQRGGPLRPDRRSRLPAVTPRNRPEPTGPSRSDSRPGGSADPGTRGAVRPGPAADPGGRGSTRASGAGPDVVRVDGIVAVGGRTPIFEEASSGWFRSYRQVPVNWSADPWTGEKPPAMTASSSSAAAHTLVHPVVAAPLSFVGPADDEWRAAARSLAAPAEPAVTAQGLPQRVPGARLIPGSRGAAAASAADVHGGPPRDADAVRNRLSGYQQGVVRGRREPSDPRSDQPDDGGRGAGPPSSG